MILWSFSFFYEDFTNCISRERRLSLRFYFGYRFISGIHNVNFWFAFLIIHLFGLMFFSSIYDLESSFLQFFFSILKLLNEILMRFVSTGCVLDLI